MVKDLLDVMAPYSTEYLQNKAQSLHKMSNGIYFKLMKDWTLSEPYVYNSKVSVADDWFSLRDFWAAYLDMQKSLDMKATHAKQYQSAIYLAVNFKMKGSLADDNFDAVYDKLCEAEDEENKKEINRSDNLSPLDREFCRQCLDGMKNVYKEALKKAEELGVGKDTIIKIFFDADIEKYQEEGKRYIYMYRLFNSGNLVVINDEICGPQSIYTNYNKDKRYMMPAGMKTANYISLEDAYRMYFIDKILIRLCAQSEEFQNDGWQFGKTIYLPFDGDLDNCYNSNTQGYKITGVRGKNNIYISDFSINDSHDDYKNNELKNLLGIENLFIGAGLTLKQAIHKYFFIPKEDDTERKRLFDSIEELVTDGDLNAVLKNYANHRMWKLIIDTSYYRAYNIVNTYLNMMGENAMNIKNMDINKIESDEEFYFAAGQLAGWLIGLSSTENAKKLNRRNFIEAQRADKIKLLIKNLLVLHADNLRGDKTFNNLVATVESYEPQKKAGNALIVGLFAENQLYRKKDAE